MGRTMSRGKQQVLFNYLPGKTFDFERIATIARVRNIRGITRTNLNATVLLRKIAEDAYAWDPEFRPALRDDILRDTGQFVLLNPIEVQAEMFPKVFWCQNRQCGRVFDYSQSDALPRGTCRVCRAGQLIQLRFVRIHRCGSLQPLVPPLCRRCKTVNQVALDTRGSERISNFRWICRRCGMNLSLFASRCTECRWPGDAKLRNMDIEVHRAGRTFYAHTTILLNIPSSQWDALLNLPDWPAVTAAKFLGLPEIANCPLTDFAPSASGQRAAQDPGLSGPDFDDLLRRKDTGELTLEQMVAELQTLRQRRLQEQQAASPGGIFQTLIQRTGVPQPTWERAGQEMLEAVMPVEIGRPRELLAQNPPPAAAQVARRMGLSRLALVTDYPIITATYGYSRAEYSPKQCRLNPFPAERSHGGKFPIFVDEVQADALLLGLDPVRIYVWLERNGFRPSLPSGSDPDLTRQAYFVQLFDEVPLRQTLLSDRPEARLVFGLLHTLSHLCIRQAALLCGLDRTSLSEYLLPRALTCAIYCNHRFGATIGALTALFEQSLTEWLNAVRNTRRCVYDPVCADREGSCHTCTYLAETSCRFFNLNLGRAFLFGGRDPQLGNISVGYFDPSLP
jgi:hypothetical protein